jgi:hypothetical protein
MKIRNTIFTNGFINSLNVLLEEKLPVEESFKLRKLAKEIAAKQEIFNETRVASAKAYALKDKKGEPIIENDNYKIPEADLAKFNQEYVDLLNKEEEYSFEKIKLSSDIKISTKDLMMLDILIEE